MKKIFSLCLCLVLVFSLIACSAQTDADFIDKNTNTESVIGGSVNESLGDVIFDQDASLNQDGLNDVSDPCDTNKQNEKIIKTVDLLVETKEFDKYLSSLSSAVASAGGYIEHSESDYGRYSYSNRHATYTVRVPADRLGEFLKKTEENGTITRKTEQQQNVTMEYIDLQSRIEAYQTEKGTLTDLLSKAESLADVLSIQERLSEVNYQIEAYTSQLKVLENRISYSTVTLGVSEVERISKVETTLWDEIKERFVNNLTTLKELTEDIIVDLVGGIPFFVILLIIVVPIIIFVKYKRKKKSNTIK